MQTGPITQQVTKLAEILIHQKKRVSCAESCTGGWLSKVLTDQPGSSAWFECGFITYSNFSKQQMLGVPEQIIEQHGAVSEPVAQAMAKGVLNRSRADYAVAVTGIAGPGGGSIEKPVGTVWLAWAGPKTTLSHCALFSGDRDAVRSQTVLFALEQLIKRINEL